jgi:hypothetical protein
MLTFPSILVVLEGQVGLQLGERLDLWRLVTVGLVYKPV